ncbi:MAG: acyl carrier protein [Candidatus Gastranaerophilaceae bacterium]
MGNLEKYTQAFVDAFEVTPEEAKTLKYQDIKAWDSVGHMGLVANIEGAFDIMLETEDIIDFSSFEKGQEILAKYDVDFSK